MQSELAKAARDFMFLFIVDGGDRGISLDDIDPMEFSQKFADLEAALSTNAGPVSMDDEDRTPMPAGFDDAMWRKADEVHHAMALVARDQECVKIIYAALSTHNTKPAGKVEVHYAYCCPGSTKYCDCVNKHHGTAWIGANEVGDDYIPVAPLAPAVAVKALRWRKYGNQHGTGWQGMGVIGYLQYVVDRGPDGEEGWFWGKRGFDTEDEAKAAVQAHYAAAIRSAVSKHGDAD